MGINSFNSYLMEDRIRAQATERKIFGNSVLAQVQRSYYDPSSNARDIYVSKDGKDDGKISFFEKVENFCKGLVSPIKNMFSSPKNIFKTVLGVAACAGLIYITGGAAAPILAALGVFGGAAQILSGVYKQASAMCDGQAAEAWQKIGSGTFAVGASALAAKSSLKAAGVKNTSNMTTSQAIGNCIKNIPGFFKMAVQKATPKLSAFFAAFRSPKASGTVVTPNPSPAATQQPVSALSAGQPKTTLGLNEGTPKPVAPVKANPPRIIELPESMTPSVVEASQPANAVVQQPASSVAPQVVTSSESKYLGLPEPSNTPQYRVDYSDSYRPKNVKMPEGPTVVDSSVVVEPTPSVKGKTGPKSSSSQSMPKAKGAIKSFFSSVGQKIKKGLKLFGFFV